MSKRSNVGLVIKSVARVETFVEEWNGHNTFAHQQFDALFQLSHFFFISISKLKFHILSRDGKMFQLSPGIKISI